MINQTDIVEKLSQFNNMSFTRKQWEIILLGCNCPKSPYFWMALRKENLIKHSKTYTLINIDNTSFRKINTAYCCAARASVKRSYERAKARKKVKECNDSLRSKTFYMIGGMLVTEKPERD